MRKYDELLLRKIDDCKLLLTPVKYNRIEHPRLNLLKVSLNNKWGFVNLKNKIVVSTEYDWVWEWNQEIVGVKNGEKYGAINLNREIIISLIYQDTKPCSQGLFAVNLKGKWGFEKKQNIIIFSFIYDAVWSFKNNKAQVRINDEYDYLIWD